LRAKFIFTALIFELVSAYLLLMRVELVCWFPLMPLSREEITKRMVELARKYVETHDPEIIKELYKLGRDLEKVEKSEK
jgi:hypothetical protein